MPLRYLIWIALYLALAYAFYKFGARRERKRRSDRGP
jgi:hypothetical protein